jgi:hypothetical protein
MTPKPPPPPPLPPAVPPDYRVIATSESTADLEREVNEALGAGQRLEGAAQVSSLSGVVVISQACSRDPQWEKRVRTRLSTQKVINSGGQA